MKARIKAKVRSLFRYRNLLPQHLADSQHLEMLYDLDKDLAKNVLTDVWFPAASP